MRRKTTAKIVTIRLTDRDLIELDSLSNFFNEGHTAIIKRAIILLHYIYLTNPDVFKEKSE